MSDTIVRMALVGDEDGIMALLIQNHAENGQHEFCEPKVRNMVRRALYQQGGIIGVIGPASDIRGSICLLIDEVWYSEERQILELWNYVRQDSRKSDYAKKMIEFAKKCADGLELDLTIGVLSDKRMEAKVKLYQRQLPKAGEFFVHHGKKERFLPVEVTGELH